MKKARGGIEALGADVLLTAEEVKLEKVEKAVCVVVDVLRATTTIVTALANQCAGILPVETPEEARRVAAEKQYLLGGERNGLKIEGFHFGNSPLEYSRENIFGRFIIFTTTNGTRAIRSCAGADTVLMAAFVNGKAVADFLKTVEKPILMVCAGTRGEPSIEDTACAGMLLEDLQRKLSERAEEAVALWRAHQHDVAGMMKRESAHGRGLVELGFEKDIEFAAEANKFSVIPVLHGGLIVRKS
ncbi:MAG: 2-phosphosulfolactate phosphatase [Candidatus Abyssobacteria bacterium SURF_5]|uniref:Probable 2-phosphosulfolactate phosphatase n=1 Tax=Abyssobacteria bacterium (strain SURF_5) TaxID=2093360 RepID=A0A3A4N3V6_ABYX5|nr:MAG: 2-phosphosulfolactate phosphatase [Candidatus Abyssubacteria bacterium SURF_5]